MNSFMSWIGGKKALRELIVSLFPLHYDKYVEVFGGAAWVLFHKPPGRDMEIYNDFNGQLVNLFRCVKEHPEELLHELRFALNSREEFERIKAIMDAGGPADPVQRAAFYYQRIRYSYGSGLDSFGGQPHNISKNFPLIRQAHDRLGDVVIEHRDFERLVLQHDSPTAFFYLDPPYVSTEGYYGDIGEGFKLQDHHRLQQLLFSVEGRFLLSYNDCELVRQLYDEPFIQIASTTRLNNMAQRYEGGSQFPELLIANYDMEERRKNRPSQITLFEETLPSEYTIIQQIIHGGI